MPKRPGEIFAKARMTLTIMPASATRAPVCILLAGLFKVGWNPVVGTMTKTFKAAIYETHGNPAEVLRVVEFPWPEPASNEVVEKMSAAPINPADLNSIEGKHPIKATLPATAGMEGAGFVIEVGSAVRDLPVGTQVILPHSFGTWR